MGYSCWPLPRAEYFHVQLTGGNALHLFACLFIYYGSELFFTLLVRWLWGNYYLGGKVAVRASVCLGGVGWRLHTSQNANTV